MKTLKKKVTDAFNFVSGAILIAVIFAFQIALMAAPIVIAVAVLKYFSII